MNMIDPAVADATVVKVVGTLLFVIGAALLVWRHFYKARKAVSGDNGERIRFEDAIKGAREARDEAHSANNAVMVVQRQLGRLEAENKACNRRTRLQAVRIGRLERQNVEQAEQIKNLSRALKGRFNPTESDLR